jgi:phosphoserine phosphatase
VSPPGLPPLVVDMDGTLVLGDTSWASAAESFRQDPLHAALASLAYVGGRAQGKRAFAAIARPKPERLKYRAPLLAFLEKERGRGRPLHIVSGADQAIVDEIAAHLGIFDSARGSDGRTNLRGATKLAWLTARFPDGFDYVGDSAADLPIWRAVKRALLVGGAIRYAARLREDGVTILATI